MALITLDIEEGHSASHDIISGWDYTRVAMVEQLAFSTSTDDLINQAIQALIVCPDISAGSITGVVGDRGTKYNMGAGSGNTGVIVFLKTFIPEIVSSNFDNLAVKIRIVYRGYPILTYEGEGSLNQIDSNIDVNGDVIAVSYTYKPSDAEFEQFALNSPPGRDVQGQIVPRDECELAFSVHFLITSGNFSGSVRGNNYTITNGSATDIFTAICAFDGTCNDANYSIGVITGSKHQWKIVNVRGASDDQGVTYKMSMTFQFRPSGWDKTATYIRPSTGQPPPDLVRSTVKVTDTTNFPEYADIPPNGTNDIGWTIAATADESTFPSFGYWKSDGVINVTNPTSASNNATFPAVTN